MKKNISFMAVSNLCICFIFCSHSFVLQAQSGYKLSASIALEGNGKWDYITADEKNNRLFVSHFDRVHVIDLLTKKEIKSINNLNGVHGIALAPALNRGFISNGKDNLVVVFDYTSLDSLTSIKLPAEKADAILYDAFTKTVWVFCGKSNNTVVIDAQTNQIITTVALGKAPEFAVTNNKGLIYNNMEEGNAIYVVDAKSKSVLKTYPLQNNAAPTGLAIDIENNLLFSACAGAKLLTVLDAGTGKIITTLPISEKVDAVAFDPATKMIFCSGADNITTIIKQESNTQYKVIERLATKKGAKTLALNKQTHQLYLSVADYIQDSKELQPNSFKVLEFGK